MYFLYFFPLAFRYYYVEEKIVIRIFLTLKLWKTLNIFEYVILSKKILYQINNQKCVFDKYIKLECIFEIFMTDLLLKPI